MDMKALNQRFEIFPASSDTPNAVLQELKNWLVASSLEQRLRINPYEVAAATGRSVNDLLSVLLTGIATGLFNMHWHVHCPHCNMVTKEHESFFELTQTSHCPMCDVSFEADFLTRIEVNFSLHPSIENPDLPAFCLPPPVLTSKINLTVMPGETLANSDKIEEPGRYRYFCPITLAKGILEVQGEPTDTVQEFKIRQLGTLQYDLNHIVARPGPIRFELTNECSTVCGAYVIQNILPDGLSLESLPVRLTGLQVIHHPDYRRLFGDQVLPEDERLQISSVALLFTDIAGSTEMYETLGNADAYSVVRDHFSVLFEAVEAHDGFVVKTIGDAVMASFMNSDDAMQSARDAIRAFARLNANTDQDHGVFVKFGVHRGPAIIVNLNSRIDYFGSTVNRAARIQDCAAANEIVVSEDAFIDSQIARDIARDCDGERREIVKLKGIETEQLVHRLTIAETIAAK